MLVILTQEQLIAPYQVCRSCLLADANGQPRWQQEGLRCGHPVCRSSEQLPEQYECQMGFRIARISDPVVEEGFAT